MKTNVTYELFGHRCAKRDHHAPQGERRWEADVPHSRSHPKRKASAARRKQFKSLIEPRHEETLNPLSVALTKCPAISVDPEVMQGRACIAGTYIPVSSVLRVIEKYGSVDETVTRYQPITAEQAKDALKFASILLDAQGTNLVSAVDADDLIRDSTAISEIAGAMSGLRSVVNAIKAGRALPKDPGLDDLLAQVSSDPERNQSTQDIEKWARQLAESVGNLAD